jgi:hypothetical protein
LKSSSSRVSAEDQSQNGSLGSISRVQVPDGQNLALGSEPAPVSVVGWLSVVDSVPDSVSPLEVDALLEADEVPLAEEVAVAAADASEVALEVAEVAAVDAVVLPLPASLLSLLSLLALLAPTTATSSPQPPASARSSGQSFDDLRSLGMRGAGLTGCIRDQRSRRRSR